MAYLLSQMWLCLLITALVSGLLGWIFRGGGKHKLRELNRQWQDKYDVLSQERNSYATKVNKLTGMSHENDRLERKIEAQKKSFDQTVKHLNKDLVNVDTKVQQQELLLTQKDEELAMSMAQFDKKITEFEDEKQSSNTELEERLSSSEKTLTEEKRLNNELQKNLDEGKQSDLQVAQIEANSNKQIKDHQQQTSKLEKELENAMSELVATDDKLNLAKKELLTASQEIKNLKKDVLVKNSEASLLEKGNENNTRNTDTQTQDLFASTKNAGLVKTGIKKAKNSLDQANDKIAQHNEADDTILPVHAIQALSDEDNQRLSSMNIKTTEDLSSKTATDTGIRLLSKSLGKEEWVVRTWANNADLIRIKGVDGILAELLELSGIDSVKKLANSTPETLSKSISTVHEHIAKRNELPSLDELQVLIQKAKKLLT